MPRHSHRAMSRPAIRKKRSGHSSPSVFLLISSTFPRASVSFILPLLVLVPVIIETAAAALFVTATAKPKAQICSCFRAARLYISHLIITASEQSCPCFHVHYLHLRLHICFFHCSFLFGLRREGGSGVFFLKLLGSIELFFFVYGGKEEREVFSLGSSAP